MTHQERTEGWSLIEALRRTVDRTVIGRWASAERALIRFGKPGRRLLAAGIQIDDETEQLVARGRERAAQYKALLTERDAAYRAMWKQFSTPLISSQLIASGRRGSATADRALFPASAWSELQVFNWKRSVATERGNREFKFYDVRILPLLDAPNAPDVLNGETLVGAFEKYVFGDPQAERLRNISLARGGAPLQMGPVSRMMETIWPLTFVDGDEEDNLLIFANPARHWNAEAQTRASDRVIRQRFARIVSMLRSGTVTAKGLDHTGAEKTIPRSLWLRKAACLDLNNGDVLETNDDRRSDDSYTRPMFTSLMLVSPDPQGIRPTERAIRKPARRARRVADPMKDALKKHGITEKGTRSWAEIARIVAPDVPVGSPEARARAVQRHFMKKKQ